MYSARERVGVIVTILKHLRMFLYIYLYVQCSRLNCKSISFLLNSRKCNVRLHQRQICNTLQVQVFCTERDREKDRERQIEREKERESEKERRKNLL